MMHCKILSKSNNSDILGQKVGSLTVLGLPFSIRNQHGAKESCVVVECDCGCIFVRRLTHIRSIQAGKIKSSSCKECRRIKAITHGETIRNQDGSNNPSRLYSIWVGMRHRCSARPGQKNYKKYVQRGITVCPEWNEFTNFRNWAINNGYINQENESLKKCDKLSIDRINPKEGYYPENCRWVTGRENSSNVATERDRIIDFLEFQLMYYEEYIISNKIDLPALQNIKEAYEIAQISDKKIKSEDERIKMIEYCNKS